MVSLEEFDLFFIQIEFGKNKSQTTLCVYARALARVCLCVGCSVVVMLECVHVIQQ